MLREYICGYKVLMFRKRNIPNSCYRSCDKQKSVPDASRPYNQSDLSGPSLIPTERTIASIEPPAYVSSSTFLISVILAAPNRTL
jgi:hypothetical protein